MTLSGRLRDEACPWVKAVVRPVTVRSSRQTQFTCFDGKKDVTKNASPSAAKQRLTQLLAMPFSRLHLQCSTRDLHVRITKKGKALVSGAEPSVPGGVAALKHNRPKRYPIPDDEPDELLSALGIMDRHGSVRPTERDKFRQINEFLKLLVQVAVREDAGVGKVSLVDCGCGSAHLTFAAYHYLAHIREIPTEVTGIDSNPALVAKCERIRESLGWAGMAFEESRIIDYSPSVTPDVVLSLHACDTATDEAICQGVKWDSRVILAAPCCQHELRSQLDSPLFRPVLRHGILKQRTAEILTDGCRAQILRILGYRTDVVEFIDSKHTPKNVMIRAAKGLKFGDRALVREYEALRDFWRIEPCLERLLSEELAPCFPLGMTGNGE